MDEGRKRVLLIAASILATRRLAQFDGGGSGWNRPRSCLVTLNFWSLLKRGINGTYISVEPFHLFRYLDEPVYRYNNRKMTDSERFDLAVQGIVGKRLTFDELTGKVGETAVN